MSNKPPPQEVADDFVRQYYLILEKCPENLHKFYHDDSLLNWPGPLGLDPQVTTLTGINDKILSSDYKNGTVETKAVDAQESHDGGVIVAVTGTVAAKDDNVTKYFNQTFFLAEQEKGFYVLNDILRVLDIPLTVLATDKGGSDDRPGIAPSEPKDEPTPAIVEKKMYKDIVIKEVVTEDAGANVDAVAASVVDSTKKSGSDEKAEGPPVSVWGQPVNLKVSYASVVARERPASPPKPIEAKPNVVKQKKTSTPVGSFAAKLASSRNAASNELAGSTKARPRSPKVGGGAPGAHIDTKGIYIGRLPYEITKQGILDVVKQFGPVKRHPDNVQIMRHEDGFCCGFVEFESVDSARRAVETHRVKFGDKEESYISYKKSKGTNGSGGRQSPTRSGVQSNNFRARESEATEQQQPKGRNHNKPREASR